MLERKEPEPHRGADSADHRGNPCRRRTACRRTRRGDRMPAAPAAGRAARGAAGSPLRSPNPSAETPPCRRRSSRPSGNRRHRAAAPGPATGSGAPRRRRCRGSATTSITPSGRIASSSASRSEAAGVAPENSSTRPARNVKTASTRGVSSLRQVPERRRRRARRAAALPCLVGDRAR